MDDMAMKEMEMHIREHVMYPATKQQIMEGCNMMSHVPDEAKKMVEMKLKDKTYMSADEVMMDMGMHEGMGSGM
jgi:hypothetical protein